MAGLLEISTLRKASLILKIIVEEVLWGTLSDDTWILLRGCFVDLHDCLGHPMNSFPHIFFLLLRMLCLSLYNQAGYWQMQGSYATGLVCLCSPWKNRYDGILSGFLKVRFIYFVVFYWTWCSSQKKDNSDIIIYIHFLFFILLFSVGFVNMPYLCI